MRVDFSFDLQPFLPPRVHGSKSRRAEPGILGQIDPALMGENDGIELLQKALQPVTDREVERNRVPFERKGQESWPLVVRSVSVRPEKTPSGWPSGCRGAARPRMHSCPGGRRTGTARIPSSRRPGSSLGYVSSGIEVRTVVDDFPRPSRSKTSGSKAEFMAPIVPRLSRKAGKSKGIPASVRSLTLKWCFPVGALELVQVTVIPAHQHRAPQRLAPPPGSPSRPPSKRNAGLPGR